MKFGGTSVATAEARQVSATRVLQAVEKGYAPVVVVSAIGRKGQPYATDTLLQLLRDIDPTINPEPREIDLMISCGEILSSVIFAHTVRALGHAAMAFRGGQAGIRTDGVYGNARIVGINPIALRKSLERGVIPVVCGFQGVFVPEQGMPGGELTTLGRGGSDTTAAALAAALNADSCEIYTDVDGVKTADPDHVKEASTLRKISYDEVAEIAHLGAKVLHPRAAEIAMKFDCPLWVKNTFSQDSGTEIVNLSYIPGRRLTGVTHTGKLTYLQVDLSSASTEEKNFLEAKIYSLLGQNGLNLYMLNLSPSGIGFAVNRDQFSTVEAILDGLVIPFGENLKRVFVLQVGSNPSKEAEAQTSLLGELASLQVLPIKLTEGCTMVSVIGHDYMQQPGVFFSVLKCLSEQNISVLQTSDSDLSLSCLIPESSLANAVDVLHEHFELAGVS